MSKTTRFPNDPQFGFSIDKPRAYPPIEVDVREWSRRTQTRSYIRRIKCSVDATNAYLFAVRGHARGVSGHQLDALHYFCDVATFDSERRARRGERPAEKAAPVRDVLADAARH